MPDGPTAQSPDVRQPPNTLATDAADINSMRGMSLGAVNPHKVTSMVGKDPDSADEFAVTRLTRGDGGVGLLR